jgi:hypothetical protein
MKRDNNIRSSNNFGLSRGTEQVEEERFDTNYDNLFGLSKSEQKLKKEERKVEMERKKAETMAMSKILNEQAPQQEAGMGMGKVLLIGGAIILVCFGAYSILKKKSAESAEDIIDSASALTV